MGLTRDDVEDTDYQAVTIDGADDEGTLARLKTLKKTVVDAAIAAHRGRIVTTTGNGILVEFASVVDAATGAAELPARVAVRNTNVSQEDRRLSPRNISDIIIDENDIFGRR